MAVKKIKESFLDSIKDSIFKDLNDKLYKVLTQDPEYGFQDKKEVDDLITPKIVVRDWTSDYDNSKGYFVEVRAELSYDGLYNLARLLTPVLQKYDKGAYFDLESPGIMNGVVVSKNGSIREGTTRNYGGAYDINPELYFSSEEVREFADQIAEDFSDETGKVFEVSDLDHLSSPSEGVYVELTSDDGYSVNAYITVDLRKARYSSRRDNSNLLFRFKDDALKQLRDQYQELGISESLKEDWRNREFTKDDLETWANSLSEKANAIAFSIRQVLKKHPEFREEIKSEVADIRNIFTNLYSNGELDESVSYKEVDEGLSSDDEQLIKIINSVYEKNGEIDSEDSIREIETRAKIKGMSLDADYLGDMISKSKEMIDTLGEGLRLKKEPLDEGSDEKDTEFKQGHVLDYV